MEYNIVTIPLLTFDNSTMADNNYINNHNSNAEEARPAILQQATPKQAPKPQQQQQQPGSGPPHVFPPLNKDEIPPEIQDSINKTDTVVLTEIGRHWIYNMVGAQKMWQIDFDVGSGTATAGYPFLYSLMYRPYGTRFIELKVNNESPLDTVLVRNILNHLIMLLEDYRVPPGVHFHGSRLLTMALEDKRIRHVLVQLLSDLYVHKVLDDVIEGKELLLQFEAIWIVSTDVTDDNRTALLELNSEVLKTVLELAKYEPDPVADVRALDGVIEDGILPFNIYKTNPRKSTDPAAHYLVGEKDELQCAALVTHCRSIVAPHIFKSWEVSDEDHEKKIAPIGEKNQRTLKDKQKSLIDGKYRYCRKQKGQEIKTPHPMEYLYPNVAAFDRSALFHAKEWNDELVWERQGSENGLDPLNKLEHLVKLLQIRMYVEDPKQLFAYMVDEGWAKLIDKGVVSDSNSMVSTTPKRLLRSKAERAKQLSSEVKTLQKTIKKKDSLLQTSQDEKAGLKRDLFVSQASEQQLKAQYDQLEKKAEKEKKENQDHVVKVASSVQNPFFDHLKEDKAAQYKFLSEQAKQQAVHQREAFQVGVETGAKVVIQGAPTVSSTTAKVAAKAPDVVADAAGPPPPAVVEPDEAAARGQPGLVGAGQPGLVGAGQRVSVAIPQAATARALNDQGVTLISRKGNKYTAQHGDGPEFECGMISNELPCSRCMKKRGVCGWCAKK